MEVALIKVYWSAPSDDRGKVDTMSTAGAAQMMPLATHDHVPLPSSPSTLPFISTASKPIPAMPPGVVGDSSGKASNMGDVAVPVTHGEAGREVLGGHHLGIDVAMARIDPHIEYGYAYRGVIPGYAPSQSGFDPSQTPLVGQHRVVGRKA
ncbi:MAG: hypothetical protein KGZ92_09815 [Firmicutes bacterium]|nr:hypothetical protein [Bacillota bacterium]